MTYLLEKYFWWIIAIAISLILLSAISIPSWIIIKIFDITQTSHKCWVVGGVIFAELIILILWSALDDISPEAVAKRDANIKN